MQSGICDETPTPSQLYTYTFNIRMFDWLMSAILPGLAGHLQLEHLHNQALLLPSNQAGHTIISRNWPNMLKPTKLN